MQDKDLNILLKTVNKYHHDTDSELLKIAYFFAQDAHEGQMRKSGEAYFLHSFQTALTLANMKMTEPIVVAGLLHDVPEDTQRTMEEITQKFGKDIASIVEGVTKVGTLKYRGMERYAENLRHMFVAIAKDPRVIIVKFADRLHNLSTLYALPKEKQMRIATETLEIYVPIAARLGMGEMKDELEDAAFRYALRDEYVWVRNLVIDKYLEKNRIVQLEMKIIERELKKAGISYLETQGRAKRLYSLYKKLLRHDRDINKIFDLVAVRIIVQTVEECYTVLGIVHQLWIPLKGRIKDYIAQPKPNGYRSLHTTVYSEEGDILEVQIRTEEMHREAEYGLAAHWQYKEGQKIPIERLKWIKAFVKWQQNFKDYKRYLDALQTIKLDVLQNHIFIFTPKGDVIELPENATPIDFAYVIHTDIGNRCSGALINGKMHSLDTPLKNGDCVEIITEKKRVMPNPDWLSVVKTDIARTKIRTALKKTKEKRWAINHETKT